MPNSHKPANPSSIGRMILLKENPILYQATVDSVLQHVAKTNAWWTWDGADLPVIPQGGTVLAGIAAAVASAFACMIYLRIRPRDDGARTDGERRRKDLETQIEGLLRDKRSHVRAIVRLNSDLIALDAELVRVLRLANMPSPSGLAGRYAGVGPACRIEHSRREGTAVAPTLKEEAAAPIAAAEGAGRAGKTRFSNRGRRSCSLRGSTTVEDGEWDYGIS